MFVYQFVYELSRLTYLQFPVEEVCVDESVDNLIHGETDLLQRAGILVKLPGKHSIEQRDEDYAGLVQVPHEHPLELEVKRGGRIGMETNRDVRLRAGADRPTGFLPAA